ncbi:hypothetical protein CEXT_76891 [Caerostris extrusa]|uniref:Uncharacterized protein n=1 Tax=Caerostris extrusa TaxID=172846 RepID=A0AAV4MKK8_CAEEX|nr:hypothetical protein CEXT_76891 [Caerostris extrusa]
MYFVQGYKVPSKDSVPNSYSKRNVKVDFSEFETSFLSERGALEIDETNVGSKRFIAEAESAISASFALNTTFSGNKRSVSSMAVRLPAT